MSKHVTIYQPNENGEIIKIESWQSAANDMGCEIPTTQGEVVDEGGEDSIFGNIWSFFFFSGSGSNEKSSEKKPYNDNGREYNSVSGNWEFTAKANGSANPYESNYKAPQDYQGSVPTWDGTE